MDYRIFCLAPFLIVSVALADSWTPISVVDAPTARTAHSAVFTRIDVTDQMIVWGGQDSGILPFANTGGRWKRSTNKWTATTTAGAPSGRQGQPAVWTGHEMIVWGGDAGTETFLNTGGRYDPVRDVWQPTTLTGAPIGRFGHSLVWHGRPGDRLGRRDRIRRCHKYRCALRSLHGYPDADDHRRSAFTAYRPGL